MGDPTLGEVHADLVARLEQDKRLRTVEQAVASQDSTMKAMLAEQAAARAEQRDDARQMEQRIMSALTDVKTAAENSKARVWPVVSSLAGVAAVLLVVGEHLFR